jgi:ribosomal protein S7
MILDHEPHSRLCHGEVLQKKKSKKSDSIYHNGLVNMFVNQITKHEEKKNWLIKLSIKLRKRFNKKAEMNPLSVLRRAILKFLFNKLTFLPIIL